MDTTGGTRATQTLSTPNGQRSGLWVKHLKGWAGSLALVVLRGLARRLPLRRLYQLAEGLGRLIYRLSPHYRKVADENLRHAYGQEMAPSQRQQLIQQVFVHFAKSLMEFLIGDSLTPDDLRRLVTVRGLEHLQQCLQDGKGVLVVTAHYGNWEIAARFLCQCLNYPLNVVAREADNPFATRLVNQLRERGGYRVIPRGRAARAVFQALKRNEIVALLPDQNAGDVFVPFFGRLAGTVAGPALLALRSGAPLLPAFCTRQPDNTFLIEIHPPYYPTPSGNLRSDIVRIMAHLTSVIEQQIRRHPSQWLWIHNRWKTRPPEEMHANGSPH